MNKQKGFVLPLVIAIMGLIIVAGSIYIYKNNTTKARIVSATVNTDATTSQPNVLDNRMPGWQSYSNTDFNIQYPPEWSVNDLKPTVSTGDHTVIFKSPNSTTTKPILLSVESWESFGPRSAAAQIEQFSNLKYNRPDKSSVVLGLISAVKFTDKVINGSWIIFEKDGYTYTLSSRNVDTATFQSFYKSLLFNK
jgi:predicted small secreted protein